MTVRGVLVISGIKYPKMGLGGLFSLFRSLGSCITVAILCCWTQVPVLEYSPTDLCGLKYNTLCVGRPGDESRKW